MRELIIDAARSCFSERGYAGTTTRQVASRAGVVENLIFKHFGSKAALFEAAVIEPFRRAADTFVARAIASEDVPQPGEAVARQYVEALYDLLEGHGELLLAATADRSGAQPLLGLMEELERIGTSEMAARDWPGANVKVLARLHFGMVAFNAAFGDALYPTGTGAPTREEVIDEMTAFIVHGSAHRAGDGDKDC
ncbi:MAG TPA: helix-turn-helix domain-containing protein [Solirubrobacteraceae bacterium]|nr:helix-turn-helix domain-containing protein [Solirubrobacteraceae bacterium]